MTSHLDNQLELEDLLADLQFARKHDQLGRLALLAYCEVKGWARRAGKLDLAEDASNLFAEHPHNSKEEFLVGIDALIETLKRHEKDYQRMNGQNVQFPSSPLSAY